MKPGKKEKIRLGQAPTKTLPSAPQSKTEDAGGGAAPQTASSGQEPVNPLEPAAPTKKTRFSERAQAGQAGQTAQGQGTEAGRTGSRSARRRRGCRPPDAGRSAGPGRRYVQEEEKGGHHHGRQDPAGRQEEEDRDPGAGVRRCAAGSGSATEAVRPPRRT